MDNYYSDADLDKAVELASQIEDSHSETDIKEILVDIGFSSETSIQATKKLDELEPKTINEQKVIKPTSGKYADEEKIVTKEFKKWVLNFLLSLCPIIIFTAIILTFAACVDAINQSFFDISFLDILSDWVFKLIDFGQIVIVLCFPLSIGFAFFTETTSKNAISISFKAIFSCFILYILKNILYYFVLISGYLVPPQFYVN